MLARSLILSVGDRSAPGASRRRADPSLRPLALAVAFALAAPLAAGAAPAVANPTGAQVVSGNATITRQGNLLQVVNSPNAIINWQSFSIAQGEITRFVQQSGASAVLNRVVGVDPSVILGALQSNGRVFLVNPNGITFGAGAQIDVAGLVASTLNLADGDFLSGRMRFTDGAGAGRLINQGTIEASGGPVYLIARDVNNSGIVRANGGEVLLAAGQTVELVQAAAPHLRVELTAPGNEAVNVGQIVARGGSVGMFGSLVRQSGLVEATRAEVGPGGHIVLRGTREVTLDAGSRTLADGGSAGGRGGEVIVDASGPDGLARVAGSIEAVGRGARGGDVTVTGQRVALVGQGSIDVSGSDGGGQVRIGGDYLGSNPELRNAWRTFFGPQASVRADALARGDGGRVIVWADDATHFLGTISARGGAAGGDGGFVETSGKATLLVQGMVDTRAPSGRIGQWLLDPTDITVISGPGTFGSLGDVELFANPDAGPNTLDVSLINGAATNVMLQARNDITFSTSVAMTNAGVGLTARAGNNIAWGSNSITTNNGAVSFIGNDPGGIPSGSGSVSGSGAINAGSAAVSLSVAAGQGKIETGVINGGAVSLASSGPVRVLGDITASGAVALTGAGNAAFGKEGVKIDSATVRSPVSVVINGTGSAGFSNAYGVLVDNGAQITGLGSAIIAIAGTGGVGGGGDSQNTGIAFKGSNSRISTVNGSLTLVGVGGSGSGGQHPGLFLMDSPAGGANVQTVNGSILINGTSGSGGAGNTGVFLSGNGRVEATGGGQIALVGTALPGTTAGGNNQGVRLNAADSAIVTNSGLITIVGIGGQDNGNSNFGVNLGTAGAQISSASGSVSVTGTAGGGPGLGNIGLRNVGVIATGGSGNLLLSGTGGNGSGSLNYGLLLEGGAAEARVANGLLSMTGTSRTVGAGGAAPGVLLNGGSRVYATGTGSIDIDGTGTPTGSGAFSTGILVGQGGPGVQVYTTSGFIRLDGTGGLGGGSPGMWIQSGGRIFTTAGGPIILSGRAINGSDNGIFLDTGEIGQVGSTGVVTFVADTIGGAFPVRGGVVSFAAETSRPVRIDSAGMAGALTITPALLGQVTALTGVTIASDQTLTVVANAAVSSPSLTLAAVDDIVVNAALSGSGSVALSTARDLDVVATAARSASVTAGGALLVIADDVLLQAHPTVANRSAELIGDGVLLNAGSLTMIGGAGVNAHARIISTGGVTASLQRPAALTAGTGANADARVDASGPIALGFPLLSGGGYSVNGVAGQIWDVASSSGFKSDGMPAILGSSLLVDYGAGALLAALAGGANGGAINAPALAALDQSERAPGLVREAAAAQREQLSQRADGEDLRAAQQCN
jgi:filamentous hemagglutinin family protein